MRERTERCRIDAARFARLAFLSASRDLPGAVASAYHAREMVAIGLGEDVAYCARLDTSPVAPRLARGGDGVLVVGGEGVGAGRA